MEFHRTCKALPWKNGRGVTNELLILPAGQKFADETFVLRLSSAKIDSSGPFSVFAKHTRYLAMLRGEVRLRHEEKGNDFAKHLAPNELYCFDGAMHTSCELLSADALDFNVFVGKEHKHSCEMIRVTGVKMTIELDGFEKVIVAVVKGKLRVHNNEEEPLQELQAVVIKETVCIVAEGEDCVCIITKI